MTLNEIALQYGTDKASTHHNYCVIYEKYLKHSRFDPIKLLELGIGGYKYADRGGESLRMWQDYFRAGVIVGVDLYEKTGIAGDRIFLQFGSQTDANFLNMVNQRHGPFDLIIDDASHVSELTIKSFEILFPLLKPTGIYIVEDVHTSLFSGDEFGGQPDPCGGKETSLKYFQRLTAQLYEKTLQEPYRAPIFGTIDFIHFYENLVIIRKK